MNAIEDLLPKWTKKIIIEDGGRDPLGLSRCAHIMTDYLLTGIITQTNRARYYSFYCWALWHISETKSAYGYRQFVDAFRRREAFLALSTISYNPGSSPVGVQATKTQYQMGLEKKEINCDFRVLPSSTLGGYGQYYVGCLYQLRFTYRNEDGIDQVTEGVAEKLAKTFHRSIAGTPYIKGGQYSSPTVSLGVLENSAKYFTLDALAEPFTTDERLQLIDIFFGFNKAEEDDRTLMRRHTLTQILHTISEYEGCGAAPNKKHLDQYLVYPVHYYDALLLADGTTSLHHIPESFVLSHLLWRQFCLQQFLTQALEELLYCLLEIAGSESAGLSTAQVISVILQADFFSLFKDITGNSCSKPKDLLVMLGADDIPDEAMSLRKQKELSALHRESESSLIAMELDNFPAKAARSLLLLAIIYIKWRGIKTDHAMNFVREHAGGSIWAGNILKYFDEWFDGQTTWKNVLELIFEQFVINQHDRVMYEKKRLDSCWLHRMDGRIIKDQDYYPRWRSTRHEQSFDILQDLKLVTTDLSGNASLTSEGMAVLKKSLSMK